MIVAPERETPGIKASDWARPKRTPCFQVRDSSGRLLRAKWSTTPMMMPKPASMAAVVHRLRRVESMASWKITPSTTIGIDPMITSQPILASGSFRSIFPTSESDQCRMIFAMSCRK